MHVFLIAAITADGYIAENSNQISSSWTSKEDRHFFRDRTKEAGVVVMGMSTYKTMPKPLPERLNVVYTRNSPTADFPVSPDVMLTQLPPAELISELEKRRYSEVAICGGSSIYTMFMKSGVIDTLYLSVEPVIFGKGVRLFTDELNEKLHLESCTQLNTQTILLEYKVLKNE